MADASTAPALVDPVGLRSAQLVARLEHERERLSELVEAEQRDLTILERYRDLLQQQLDQQQAQDGAAAESPKLLAVLKQIAGQRDRVERATARLDRVVYERAIEARWLQREHEVLDELRQQYAGLGVQYEILARRVTAATLRAERLEASGREVDAGEWQKVAAEVRANVQAMQRYTETEKSEVLQVQVNQKVVGVLRELETLIQPQSPELWQQVLHHIRRTLSSGQG